MKLAAGRPVGQCDQRSCVAITVQELDRQAAAPGDDDEEQRDIQRLSWAVRYREGASAGSRQAHVGASAELGAVADEVVQVVRVMDGLNRYRFLTDPELLAAWDSANNVSATPRSSAAKPGASGTAPAGGEVRPAA